MERDQDTRAPSNATSVLVEELTLSERFRLIRLLGKGGMGEVWLAHDSDLDEKVALKILDPGLGESTEFVDLLRQECRKARALVHPNIVRVYDFHSDGQHHFISMQYIDGESLASFRRKGFQQILGAALMVCDALEYSHRSGIVHRDIKPSNVLVDNNGVCYLTDFGIAAAIASDDYPDQLRGGGSLPYSSPQQVDGEQTGVTDDVYSLGALIYDLITGQPLFHPDVSAQRIREEVPPMLTSDGEGQAIPEPLVKLIGAMLEKAAVRRPAGIGAARAVIEEVLADHPSRPAVGQDKETGEDIILPVGRRKASRVVKGPAPSAQKDIPASTQLARGRPGLSTKLVYVGLATLVLLALGVIFYLPNVVRERGPVVLENAGRDTSRVLPDEDPRDGPDPAASEAQREIVDVVLGELLSLDDRLRALSVDLWGGSDWTEVRALVDSGDELYRARDYAGALANYRQALPRMQAIESRAPEVLANAIKEGKIALQAGNQPLAIENFELALAMDGGNAEVTKNLSRAMQLDQVLALMTEASEAESNGSLSTARTAYEKILALDPDWQPARDGLQRTRAGIAKGEYEIKMAAGYNALAAGDYSRSRSAFKAALRARPNDAEATAALAQLDAEVQLQEIVSLQQQAKMLVEQENWPGVVEKFESILSIDPNLASAKTGLEQARQRAELHEKLDYQINRSDRFNEDKIAQQAQQVLASARSVDHGGPVLTGQVDQLARLLEISAIPVPVSFESDNLTEVVLYKVGSLGTFLTRTLELKPGGYVAVGHRDGYRDVRRSFRVVADGNMQAIVLRCEEPI